MKHVAAAGQLRHGQGLGGGLFVAEVLYSSTALEFEAVIPAVISSLIVCEMSGSYGLLVPLMLVCIVSVALSSRWTIYEEQVTTMVDSPAHQGDVVIDMLEQVHVREVMDSDRKLDLVPEAMPLDGILHLAASSRNTHFPVVDSNDKLVGILSLRHLRSVLAGDGDGALSAGREGRP